MGELMTIRTSKACAGPVTVTRPPRRERDELHALHLLRHQRCTLSQIALRRGVVPRDVQICAAATAVSQGTTPAPARAMRPPGVGAP